MAIEKTYFTDYDLTPIHTWLSANATDYFSSVTISEDKLKITCYVGELDAFTITRDTGGTEQGAIKFTLKTKNGYSVGATSMGAGTGGKSYSHIYRITKTSSGIAFALKAYVQPHNNYLGKQIDAKDGVFITKDIHGNVAFVWADLLMTGAKFVDVQYNQHEHLSCINPESAAASAVSGTTSEANFGTSERDYVQLVPISINNQNTCYLPNCCLSYYSSVLGTEVPLVQGDTKYVYNGYIALKE